MASASCSSTSIRTPELLCCSQSLRRWNRELRLLDDRNFLVNGNRLLFDGKTAYRLMPMNEKRTSCARTDNVQLLGKSNFSPRPLRKQHAPLIKAVAMVERTCLVPCETGYRGESDMHFSNDADSQVFQSPEDAPEMDEKEKLRRLRISKANKGNVPWNLGRKHSAETRQRIRERTRIAMQDPKVKMKLVNLGHAQSEETRNKIGVGVREGWQRRREKLVVQERCLFEWQNMIAEASKSGYAGEDELQWDSYKTFDERLKVEWLESVEERRTMPRVKGSKRAPKSPEQRRKISEAISAKWADPEYRSRVYDALARYHGTTIGVERKPRKKPTGEKSPATKKKPLRPKDTNDEQKSIKKSAPRRKRIAAPSYKDPMAKSKLEMIKKIRAKRTAMETKKRAATERAKLLIAEAEKAAKALEVAALKSPLALASLNETRKLIAEAVRSIESIEKGQVRSQEADEEAQIYSTGPINNFGTNRYSPGIGLLSERVVNGSNVLRFSDSGYKDFQADKFTLDDTPSNGEPLHVSGSTGLLSNIPREESSRTDLQADVSESTGLLSNIPKEKSSRTDLQSGKTKIIGPIVQNKLAQRIDDDDGGGRALQVKHNGRPMAPATKTKKWVCGRLVEVEDS